MINIFHNIGKLIEKASLFLARKGNNLAYHEVELNQAFFHKLYDITFFSNLQYISNN